MSLSHALYSQETSSGVAESILFSHNFKGLGYQISNSTANSKHQLGGEKVQADTSSNEKLAPGSTALVMPQAGTLKSCISMHQIHAD